MSEMKCKKCKKEGVNSENGADSNDIYYSCPRCHYVWREWLNLMDAEVEFEEVKEMIKTDKEIGRQDGESDASFFLKIITLARIETDKERRKYMAKRLEELQKGTVGTPPDLVVFSDGSKIRVTAKRELNEYTDEIDNILKYEIVESGVK